MKNTIKTLSLLIVLLSFFYACRSLEEESIIPEGYTNLLEPKFSEKYTLMQKQSKTKENFVQLLINLDSLGNLNILRYGVVWSNTPGVKPSLNFPPERMNIINKLLSEKQFMISGGAFTLNQTYELWPFVETGKDVYFFEKPILFTPSQARVNPPSLSPILDSACSVTFNMKFEISRDNPPVYYGLFYSEDKNPLLDKDTLKILGPMPGKKVQIDTFQPVTGLKPLTRYFVWVYTQNPDGSFSVSDSIEHTTKSVDFPTASFTINTDDEIFQDAVVQFTTTFNSDGAYYKWDFSDQKFATAQNPLDTFDGPVGKKNVKLEIRKSGCVQNLDTILNVVKNPFKDYWVLVEGGTFDMGCFSINCPTDAEIHPVQLSAYYMGKTEVTQEQWVAITKNNPSTHTKCNDCPVESITWDWITNDFLPKLERKTGIKHYLPTEAQWEYAARDKGEKTYDYPGTRLNRLGFYAWYDNNSDDTTHSVKTRSPNQLGLYDMSGNVAEICRDYYVENYHTMLEVNPSGPENPPSVEKRRVVRGGAYNSSFLDLRVFSRGHEEEARLRNSVYGIRLVKKKP